MILVPAQVRLTVMVTIRSFGGSSNSGYAYLNLALSSDSFLRWSKICIVEGRGLSSASPFAS